MALLGLGAVGCSPTGTTNPGGASPASDKLNLGGYSVVKEVCHDGLVPAFQRRWKAKTGRAVTFEESYDASGTLSRKVRDGQFEADVVIVSLEDDMDQIAAKGLLSPAWKSGPAGGMLTRSLVVIGHRPGNPKGINGWDDLARPGVKVLYPDPKTSGGARWNINAIYGAARLASKEAHGGQADEAAVADFLAKVQANVVNMDASGRQSVANFERGTGDALVTYENELLLRKKQGREVPYVIPERTLLIESPAAVVDKNVDKHGSRAVAEAFLEFLRSPDGQEILGEYGYRPIDPKLPDPTGRPLPAKLFTMADLGGWAKVKEAVYGPKGAWTSIFLRPGREK